MTACRFSAQRPQRFSSSGFSLAARDAFVMMTAREHLVSHSTASHAALEALEQVVECLDWASGHDDVRGHGTVSFLGYRYQRDRDQPATKRACPPTTPRCTCWGWLTPRCGAGSPILGIPGTMTTGRRRPWAAIAAPSTRAVAKSSRCPRG